MTFAVAFGFALILVPVLRRLGLAVGLVDRPGHSLAIHEQEVPFLGGVAVVASTFGALAVLRGALPPTIFAAVTVALGGGLIDDWKGWHPVARLLVLVGAGGILAAWGAGEETLGPVGIAGVLILVPVTANAVNVTDGQDGLAGGLAAAAALGLAGLAMFADGEASVALGLGLAGSLAAFLLWNRPPARIFLGNGGAYAVGTLLAILAALATIRGGWSGFLGAGMCLGVFAFEIAFTVIRRVGEGRHVTAGDRLHSYDLLAGGPGGRPRVTWLFWLVGVVVAGLGVAISVAPLVVGATLAAVVAGGAFVFGVRLWARASIGMAPGSEPGEA